MRTLAPFLLTMPMYAGTLAAARCLGSRGIPVTMAGEDLLAPARWSRHVRRWAPSPSVFDTERFFGWLLDFGRREPGHVLYPTCDDLAWLIAQHANELSAFYRLYQPAERSILSILDKKTLYHACSDAGLDTVRTAFPSSRAQVLELARAFAFPVLLKPRTQVLLKGHGKGLIVDRIEDLGSAYDAFGVFNRWRPGESAIATGASLPMLQEYLPQACQGIYSLAGFVGPRDHGVAARASRKILQRPRRLGVGLCFEEAPVDHAALEGITRLCHAVGYTGVFEAEFIGDEGRLRLIDLNPRFYGQMGFEIARGLPLACLTWLGAMGDEDGLGRVLAEARAWSEGRGYTYCDGFYLNVVLSAQRWSGRMSPAEVRHWRSWQRDHDRRALMVDAAAGSEDRLPGMVAAARELFWAVRYPGAFVRKIILDGNLSYSSG
jgi:D-aspartate ligase